LKLNRRNAETYRSGRSHIDVKTPQQHVENSAMQLNIHNGGVDKENSRQTAQPACNPNPTQTTKTSHPANPQEVVVLRNLSLLQQEKKQNPTTPPKNKKHETKKNRKELKVINLFFQ
jgi:hypothetical protein